MLCRYLGTPSNLESHTPPPQADPPTHTHTHITCMPACPCLLLLLLLLLQSALSCCHSLLVLFLTARLDQPSFLLSVPTLPSYPIPLHLPPRPSQPSSSTSYIISSNPLPIRVVFGPCPFPLLPSLFPLSTPPISRRSNSESQRSFFLLVHDDDNDDDSQPPLVDISNKRSIGSSLPAPVTRQQDNQTDHTTRASTRPPPRPRRP